MESTEFDATLGGTEHLPFSANSLKFSASRSVEIAAMTESILRPSKTKLIFQSLPVHMRRRVMSHNSKRLPRRLRQAHLEQLKKSGLPPKQKRPSRKYRRRPANLLDEYNRRQKRNVWLETHIWHAKRFKMIERWGHRLAYAPCDKAFRACYRGSSAHCLMQDISYYTPIRIEGPVEAIQKFFTNITSRSCGLSVSAKAYISGAREGALHLYAQDRFPFGYLGKVQFVWEQNNTTNKNLWIFVHPSQTKQIESLLTDILIINEDDYESAAKRRKITNSDLETIKINVMQGGFNRFRLTGPNSHAILVHSLKCDEKIKNDDWTSIHQPLYMKEKSEYWNSLKLASSPSQLSPNMVIGLVVKDPRLSRPSHRNKAKQEIDGQINRQSLIRIPPYLPDSPLWNTKIIDALKKKRMTNGQFIEHISKTQLVPGEINMDDPALQSIPVILIQRPGSQDSEFKKIGYGSGWDVIVPAGYGLPFWLTFIMFGARSGGLRESESLAFEMGECYLPPDSDAGKIEEKRIESELRDRYFRLPPSKRVNYIKFAVNSPFICPWNILLSEWATKPINDFFVLRDRNLLCEVQECIHKKKSLPNIQNSPACLIPVYIKLVGKGSLRKHALVCQPEYTDASNIKTLFEPHHEDPNEEVRKRKRSEHIKLIKQLKRKRMKIKKKLKVSNLRKTERRVKQEPSEYVKCMRELWLPTDIKTARNIASRQVMGYISQGAFSFTEAHSCGIGYVSYNALNSLLVNGLNEVLVRNTSSRKYRLANIIIVKHV